MATRTPSDPPEPGCAYPGDCELTRFLRERSADQDRAVVPEEWKRHAERASKVRLLLLDVDGVLTDASLFYPGAGEEMKVFNSRDGFGMNLARKGGVAVGVITARQSEAMSRRAADLKLDHLVQGCRNKVEACAGILAATGITLAETAFMGDDWLDLSLLSRVGFAAAPADADPEVLRRVHFVSSKGGGRGAVRELCELILCARGHRDRLLIEYLTRQ